VAQVSDWALLRAQGHSGGANLHFTDEPTHRRVYAEVARATGEVDANRLRRRPTLLPRRCGPTSPRSHHRALELHGDDHKDVNVVSNCDAVELFVNARRSAATRRLRTRTSSFFAASDGPRARSARSATGARDGGAQEKKTGAILHLRLTATTGPDGLRATVRTPR